MASVHIGDITCHQCEPIRNSNWKPFVWIPSLCFGRAVSIKENSSAVVVKHLPYWLIGELLQELLQLIQRVPLNPVTLRVPGWAAATLNDFAVVVHTAVSVPQVVGYVDPVDVVLDDPVVGGGNGAHQHVGLGALGPEQVSHLGLMDPPRVLVKLWVLGDHVGQGEGGVTAWDCCKECWLVGKKRSYG